MHNSAAFVSTSHRLRAANHTSGSPRRCSVTAVAVYPYMGSPTSRSKPSQDQQAREAITADPAHPDEARPKRSSKRSTSSVPHSPQTTVKAPNESSPASSHLPSQPFAAESRPDSARATTQGSSQAVPLDVAFAQQSGPVTTLGLAVACAAAAQAGAPDTAPAATADQGRPSNPGGSVGDVSAATTARPARADSATLDGRTGKLPSTTEPGGEQHAAASGQEVALRVAAAASGLERPMQDGRPAATAAGAEPSGPVAARGPGEELFAATAIAGVSAATSELRRAVRAHFNGLLQEVRALREQNERLAESCQTQAEHAAAVAVFAQVCLQSRCALLTTATQFVSYKHGAFNWARSSARGDPAGCLALQL